jgi:hypothetical protein
MIRDSRLMTVIFIGSYRARAEADMEAKNTNATAMPLIARLARDSFRFQLAGVFG